MQPPNAPAPLVRRGVSLVLINLDDAYSTGGGRDSDGCPRGGSTGVGATPLRPRTSTSTRSARRTGGGSRRTHSYGVTMSTGETVLVVSRDGCPRGVTSTARAPLAALLRVEGDIAEVVQRLDDLADTVAGQRRRRGDRCGDAAGASDRAGASCRPSRGGDTMTWLVEFAAIVAAALTS